MNNYTRTHLYAVYGTYLPDDVYKHYCNINPLELDMGLTNNPVDKYWECTNRFLTSLHEVLLDPAHSLSIDNIKTENYYFLAKVCVDRSFDVGDLINIRNIRNVKYNKDLANQISHHVLPLYITNLYTRVKEGDYRPHVMSSTPVRQFMNPATNMPFQPYQPYQPYYQNYQPYQSYQTTPSSYTPPTKQASVVKPDKPKIVAIKKCNADDCLSSVILIPTESDLPATIYDCYRPHTSQHADTIPVVGRIDKPPTIPNI